MSGIDAHFRGRLGAFSLDAAFAAPGVGVTGLFGPSGCGKTTVLRCLAGLSRFTDGRLSIDGAVWQDEAVFLPSHRRAVGYVFQDARLFPHLSVLENLRYGLKRSGPGTIGLEPIIELLGLRALLARAPAALSGGERQRVAVGRALLSQPRLLLMDEPLSALDAGARQEIMPYLEGLPAALSVPILYVSHDLAELERLADHILLMQAGRVIAQGPLQALIADLSLPLARRPDASAVLSIAVTGYDAAYDLSTAEAGGCRLLVPGMLGPAGARRRLRVRAADVSLALEEPHGTSVLNVLPMRIAALERNDAHQILVLLEGRAGAGLQLLSRITRRSADTLALVPGMPVFAQVKGMALIEGPRS